MKEVFCGIFIMVFCAIIGTIIFAFNNIHTLKSELTELTESWEKREQKRKEITQKFRKLLFDLCDKESIYIEFFNDIYQLNEVTEYLTVTGERNLIDPIGHIFPKEELAAGKYVYLKKQFDTPERRVLRQIPRIELRKNEDVTWTLAHELGHHFTIQYQNIETEDAASFYIKTLAEQLLTEEEQKILELEIKIYSRTYKEKEDGKI